jgi:hypothetical protein
VVGSVEPKSLRPAWDRYPDPISKVNKKPGMAAYTCNPRYLGGRDGENHSLKPARVKSLQNPISTNKKLSVVVTTCHPTYPGSVTRRIVVQSGLGINMRPYLKINQSKK